MTTEIADTLVNFGSEIKALEETADGWKFGGYLVVFDSADISSMRDRFTKSTDFDFEDGESRTIYYNHGLDGTFGKSKIGKGQLFIKDDGVWIQGEIKKRTDYLEKHIERVAQGMKMTVSVKGVDAPLFGLSSGVPAHLVERKSIGDGHVIEKWSIAEASITPVPAEPLTSCISLKSLVEIEEHDAEIKAAASRGWQTQPRDDMGRWTDGAGNLSAAHVAHVMRSEGIHESHHAAVLDKIKDGTHKTRADVLAHIDSIHATGKAGEAAPAPIKPTYLSGVERTARDASGISKGQRDHLEKVKYDAVHLDPQTGNLYGDFSFEDGRRGSTRIDERGYASPDSATRDQIAARLVPVSAPTSTPAASLPETAPLRISNLENPKEVARRYSLPDDFYDMSGVTAEYSARTGTSFRDSGASHHINSKYATPELEAAQANLAQWQDSQSVSATTGRRMARERLDAAVRDVVSKARASASATNTAGSAGDKPAKTPAKPLHEMTNEEMQAHLTANPHLITKRSGEQSKYFTHEYSGASGATTLFSEDDSLSYRAQQVIEAEKEHHAEQQEMAGLRQAISSAAATAKPLTAEDQAALTALRKMKTYERFQVEQVINGRQEAANPQQQAMADAAAKWHGGVPYEAPKKEPRVTKDMRAFFLTDEPGFVSNAEVLIKGDMPKGADVNHIEEGSRPKSSKLWRKQDGTEVKPVLTKPQGYDAADAATASTVRVYMSDGTAVNKQYLDLFTGRFPDATFHTAGRYKPVIVKSGGKRVGIMMPMVSDARDFPDVGRKSLFDGIAFPDELKAITALEQGQLTGSRFVEHTARLHDAVAEYHTRLESFGALKAGRTISKANHCALSELHKALGAFLEEHAPNESDAPDSDESATEGKSLQADLEAAEMRLMALNADLMGVPVY